MRGSPLIRAAIAFFIILSLGYPLSRMTGAGDASPAMTTPRPDSASTKTVHIALTFTLPPKSVKVSALGQEIWTETAPAAELEKDLSIAYPAEGVDLRFQVEWPDDAPIAAMRVKLTDPKGDDHEKSVWSKGPADEAVTFP